MAENGGHVKVDCDYMIDELNYKSVILDRNGIDLLELTQVLQDVVCVAHTNRLCEMWDNKFYIENCDVQEIDSEEEFITLLEAGYVIRRLALVEGELYIEADADTEQYYWAPIYDSKGEVIGVVYNEIGK